MIFIYQRYKLELENKEEALNPEHEFFANIVWAPRIQSLQGFLFDCIDIPSKVGFPSYGSDKEFQEQEDKGKYVREDGEDKGGLGLLV